MKVMSAICVTFVCVLFSITLVAEEIDGINSSSKRVTDELIVKFKQSSMEQFRSSNISPDTTDLQQTLQINLRDSRPLFKTKSESFTARPSQSKSATPSSYREYKETNDDEDIFVLGVEEDAWESTYKALKNNDNVEYVIPNYEVSTNAITNDPYYTTDLWGMEAIGYSTFSNAEQFTNETTIAVIDTGLDLTHPDIAGKYFINEAEIADNGIDDDNNGFIDDINGWSFYEHRGAMLDNNGHGTHVSGTIGAAADNGIGIAGVASNGRILPVRALGASGSGSLASIIAGIDYAVMMGADVINMSIGVNFDLRDSDNQVFIASLNERFAVISDVEKVAIVVAAGNNHDNNIHHYWPAGADNVITVGAIQEDEGVYSAASFSNFGNDIDLWAPGVDVLSLRSVDASSSYTEVYDGYASVSGTSMATPHVAGAAALVKSAFPYLTGNQVKRVLKQASAATDGALLEKGLLNVSNLELINNAYAAINIELRTDYYYIDNASQDNIDVYGRINSAAGGNYSVSLEKTGGSSYASTSGTFLAEASADTLLATIPYPSEAANGLSEFTIVVTADNGVMSKTMSVPIIINDSDSMAEGYNANFPFFGDNYSSYPGTQYVAYSNVIDLDGDGVSELVTVRGSTLSDDANQLFVYDLQGNLKSGFPYSFSESTYLTDTKLYFKDFDEDGTLEIVIAYVNSRADATQATHLKFLVINNAGEEHIASFTKDIFASNVFRGQGSKVLLDDFNNDGVEEIIVFQAVFESSDSFSHLQTNVYDLSGNELLSKNYDVDPSWYGGSYYYLKDAMVLDSGNTKQDKKYVLYSSPFGNESPLHFFTFDDNFELVTSSGTTYQDVKLKYNYKSFDLDQDGYRDFGFISWDRNETYSQLKIYKDDYQTEMSIDLPVRTYSLQYFNFFIGNILGDEENEIITINALHRPSSSTYDDSLRIATVYDSEGEEIKSFKIEPLELGHLFTLANTDDDEYDELVFGPIFYKDKVVILNGDDLSVQKEVQLTSTPSGMNQLPALSSARSYPIISKLEEDGNYHLFLTNRKVNAIDLGISEQYKVRWFHGYGNNANDFSQNPMIDGGLLTVTFDVPESYFASTYDNHVATVINEDGEVITGEIVIEGDVGRITYTGLPFDDYTIQFEGSNYLYSFSGEQEVDFSENGQTVELEINKLVQPNKSNIILRIQADKSFDEFDENSNAAIINLTTGAQVEDTLLNLLGRYTEYNEYHMTAFHVPAADIYQVSFSTEKNGYRYFIETQNIELAEDNQNNEVIAILQRELLITE